MPDRVLISGTGLVGASIGLGLRAAGWDVAGWDPDPEASSEALRRGAVDYLVASVDDAEADFLVLAGPLPEITAALSRLHTDALVTDVAGVKGPVVAAAEHLPRFVGGHPMAGGATRGPAMASSHLFHGAPWVLTTDGARGEDLDAAETLVKALGANPIRMTASEHDAAVARVSHLPHLIAAALVGVVSKIDGGAIAGGGFRDLTRVAASDTSWWPDVLGANSTEVVEAIGEIENELEALKDALAASDRESVAQALERARLTRTRLGEHHAQLRVILLDRPGELARVGHALEASEADVRDIQLRHGEHGGGGVLTISVTPRSADGLRRALEAEAFTIES